MKELEGTCKEPKYWNTTGLNRLNIELFKYEDTLFKFA